MRPRDRLRWIRTAGRVMRHPYGSVEALRDYQLHELGALVDHAVGAVPFYRELYGRSGVDPSSLRDLRDLDRLPTVTKEALRAAPVEEVLDEGSAAESLPTFRTSGSTGKPFAIRRSHAEDHLLRLFRRRALHQLGVRALDLRAAVSEPPLGGPHAPRPRTIAERFEKHRRVLVSCLQPVQDIAEQLERIEPAVVSGYPGVLSQVASHLSAASRSLLPKLVHTGGEPLQPHHRRRIEAGFGSRVFDTYGAHEFNLLAWECPESGLLHVCEDNVILEVLKDGEPAEDGEEGELVVTGLHTRTMPFIRYLTRDIATRGPSPCPCGQPFSTLRAVRGRTPHYLRLTNHRIVHPFEITGPLIEEHGDWIDQHQLVQKAIGEVTLRIAPLRTPEEAALERLHTLGRRALGDEARFGVELVTSIRPDRSGKFQPYVSELPSDEPYPLDADAPAELQP